MVEGRRGVETETEVWMLIMIATGTEMTIEMSLGGPGWDPSLIPRLPNIAFGNSVPKIDLKSSVQTRDVMVTMKVIMRRIILEEGVRVEAGVLAGAGTVPEATVRVAVKAGV